MESILSHVFVKLVFLVIYVKWILMIAKVGTFLRLVCMRTQITFTFGVLRLFCTQNRDYNRSLNPVGTFDVFVTAAAIFLASKPEPAQ